MATQLSVSARNARLDAIETAIGVSPKLQLRTGPAPVNCAAADTGSLIAEITMPADWMNAASSGSKTMLGTWQVNASGTGTVGHYRLKDSTGTTTHVQGSVTVTGGGGDMEIQNTSVNAGQQITVTSYTLTDGNA
jgi:hypothetical protein